MDHFHHCYRTLQQRIQQNVLTSGKREFTLSKSAKILLVKSLLSFQTKDKQKHHASISWCYSLHSVFARYWCSMYCVRQGLYRQWKVSENSAGSEKSAKLGSQWKVSEKSANLTCVLWKWQGRVEFKPQMMRDVWSSNKHATDPIGQGHSVHYWYRFSIWTKIFSNHYELDILLYVYRRMEKLMWSLIVAQYYCLFSQGTW